MWLAQLAPLLAAMVLSLAGIAGPAHGAVPALATATARAAVNVSANGNFQLVFVGDSAQVAGQVLPASPTGKVPTGTVDLLPDSGSTVLSTSELSNNILPGLFVLIAPPLPLGTQYFRAAYRGDSNFAPKTVRFPINVLSGPQPAAVSTEFHSSHHGDIPLGQAVTVRTVIGSRAPSGATPTGMVQFYDWNTRVGAPVKLVNGKAGFIYTSLSPGKHVLQAKYLGSSAYPAGFTPARTVNLVG